MHSWRHVVLVVFLIVCQQLKAQTALTDQEVFRNSDTDDESAKGESEQSEGYDEYEYILSLGEADLTQQAIPESEWQHRISAENSATQIDTEGRIENDWRYRWESFRYNIGVNGSRCRLFIDVVDVNKEWYGSGLYDWVFSSDSNRSRSKTVRWHLQTSVEYGYFEDQQYERLLSSERSRGLSLSLQREVERRTLTHSVELGARWQRVARRDEIIFPFRGNWVGENEKDLLLPFLALRWLYSAEYVDTQLDLRYEKNIGDDEQSGIEILLDGGKREVNFQHLEAQLFQHWWLQQYYFDDSLLQVFFSYELSFFDGFGEPLISDGQWPVGGKYSVRGYDDDASSADSGNLLRVELGSYYFHSSLKTFRAFTFFDTARYQIEASELNTQNQLLSRSDELSLRSTGFGVELSLNSGLAAEIVWGRVLESVTTIAEEGDHRFHINLSWTF